MTGPGPAGRPEVVCVGLTTVDTVYTVAHHPAPDEKITAARQDLAAGGPAANAAVTCSALGSRTTLVTALGSHPLAAVAADYLHRHGVEVVDATPDDASAPALSSIYVQPATATRSVVSVNAADRSVPAPPALDGLVGGARVVLVDGHHPDLLRSALVYIISVIIAEQFVQSFTILFSFIQCFYIIPDESEYFPYIVLYNNAIDNLRGALCSALTSNES